MAFHLRPFARPSLVLAVALLGVTGVAHARDLPGGIKYVQDEAAVAVYDGLVAMNVPTTAGPGGPVDSAITADSLACRRDAATALVTCKAEASGANYASDAADDLGPMFDALSGAIGVDASTSFTVKQVQCYRNSMPVGGAICGFTVGE
jgi:hypothetical protein